MAVIYNLKPIKEQNIIVIFQYAKSQENSGYLIETIEMGSIHVFSEQSRMLIMKG